MNVNRGWWVACALGPIALFADGSASAAGPVGHIPGRHIDRYGRVLQQMCPAELRGPGEARCFSQRIIPDVQPDAIPVGLGADGIAQLYSIPAAAKSGGAIVAIVDVGGYPNALTDVNAYRTQYGLPSLTKCSSTLPTVGGAPCLALVSETGTTTLPKANSDWEGEEALDLDMVSATCPDCSIVLVQAKTQNNSDLDTAVDFAASIPGISAVSNSYGWPETGQSTGFSTADASHYSHPGVLIVAASGDQDFDDQGEGGTGPSFPASAPTVLGVGGTTPSVSGTTWTETVWNLGNQQGGAEGGGSGCSSNFARPTFQAALSTGSCAAQWRASVDVSAAADYSTTTSGGGGILTYESQFQQVLGTSAATPIVAGILTRLGLAAKVGADLGFVYTNAASFNDIADGSNNDPSGACTDVMCTAGKGWDGPTGVGTPNGAALELLERIELGQLERLQQRLELRQLVGEQLGQLLGQQLRKLVGQQQRFGQQLRQRLGQLVGLVVRQLVQRQLERRPQRKQQREQQRLRRRREQRHDQLRRHLEQRLRLHHPRWQLAVRRDGPAGARGRRDGPRLAPTQPAPEVTERPRGEGGRALPATSAPICARSCVDEALHRVPSPRPRRLRRVASTRSTSSRTRFSGGRDVAGPAARDPAADDGPLRVKLAQFVPAVITADVSTLPAAEKRALDSIIAAAHLLDPVFDRQAWTGNPALHAALAQDASDHGKLLLAYVDLMRGPWDRQDHFKPFAVERPHPAGGGFYPEDVTADAFKAYVVAHPDQKDALESLTTVVAREGDKLKAVPYSQAYAEWLKPAAARLLEAAATTQNKSLARFLTSRAAAFASDDYRQSDKDWMDLDSRVEPTIGPYETYDDDLLGQKAAFEAYVTVSDPAASAKLAKYKRLLPDMEQNLPIPAGAHGKRGGDSPIRVVDLVFTSGEARQSVQTIAFNLPNDEVVRKEKGAKKVLLRNLIEVKFDRIMRPLAERILDASQVPLLSSESFFDETLFHELSHSLGPAFVKGTKDQEVRVALESSFSAIEECKADVMGAYNILYLVKRGELPKDLHDKLLVSYFAGLFRSTRFGVAEAHGQGAAVQINRFVEDGAARFDPATRRYTVDLPKLEASIGKLVHDLCDLQWNGNKAGADALLAKYGTMSDSMTAAMAGLSGIPVDIKPIYPVAGESAPAP